MVIGLVVGLALLAAPAAWGQSPTPSMGIQSAGPLSTIWIGNELSCQVQHAGESTTEFTRGGSGPGDCGTFLQINTDDSPSGLFGPDFVDHAGGTNTPFPDDYDYSAFMPVSQSLSGSGTAASPYKVTTVVEPVSDGDTFGVTVTEVDSYVVGNDFYSTTVTVDNVDDVFFTGRLYHAGGCFLHGSGSGFGALEPSQASPSSAACATNANNSPASALEDFVPNTPGAIFAETTQQLLWNDIGTETDLPNDTCDCATSEANSTGIEWTLSLESGTSDAFSFNTVVNFPPISATGGTTFIASAPATITGTLTTFTDPQTTDTASQFSATVNWGDGTSTIGTITGGNGSFAVMGSHTYGTGGSFPVSIAIQQVGNSFNSAVANDTADMNAPPSPVITGAPAVTSPNGAAFSGSVNPDGLATTAYFQYGIPRSAQGPEGAGPTFTEFTPTQAIGSDFSNHAVSASVSGLVPNELYDVQLVATNSAGTTYGPVESFTTAHNSAPPAPVLGKQVNVQLVSGHVWIKPPPGKSLGPAGDTAALSKGQGFVPLTEARQIPTGSQVDALHGSLRIVSNTGKIGKTQTATLAGGVFNIGQIRKGISKGLTTFNLVESAFQGAPTYTTCKAKYKKAGDATIASLSSKTLQLLKVSGHGKFRTTGRYSSATVRGTIYTVADKCNGTLTHVIRDTVLVDDFARHKTILLHAGQSYLAEAIASRR